ncbi:hypothetical protein DFA_07872 [Cavenderia fasciculata]|uniref:Uncharacterized protein n=1 Tax=Cavenderia fasciculata TaxID=261658 RepID=F4Q3S5_CACFS|nr:uncharacterized protein DFA_07872 [Cavenderia fasciculata]EGG16891.1 hypothetical protein DFA_07872 [Cavenderia fasciculata]|eukprot:XP_004355365.1 hypothetical protein DFA_07872 [Cavenderia fasciculata]
MFNINSASDFLLDHMMMDNSLSLPLSLPTLPWVIQTEIIYILCNYRRNEYIQSIRLKDVFNIASVSHTWRHATKVSLSLDWVINVNRHSLKEYRQHSETQLCLLSQPNQHKLHLVLFPSNSNLEYADQNQDCFKESVVDRLSYLAINRYTPIDWNSHIKGRIPSLKAMHIYSYIDQYTKFSLEVFQCLEQLQVVFSGTKCQQICNVLSSCQNLKSLTIDIQSCIDLDVGKVFSSIPRTTNKLIWGDINQYQPSYDPSVKPYPFHLLPDALNELVFWDANLVPNQPYYDYVLGHPVRKVIYYNLVTPQFVDFLSCPSSPIKDLMLYVIDAPKTFSIAQRAIVPPLIESLELIVTKEIGLQVLECVFKHNGPLPNLHTIKIDSSDDFLHLLIHHIQQPSQSILRVIDFSIFFTSPSANQQLLIFLDAVTSSKSIEKVYFRNKLKNREEEERHTTTIKIGGVVLNVAGVSRAWRRATITSLTICWYFNTNKHSIEEYRHHSENELSLFSGVHHPLGHHTLDLVLHHGSDIARVNKEYMQSNFEWFKDNVMRKVSDIYIDDGRETVDWMDTLMRVGHLPTLEQLTWRFDGEVHHNIMPLDLFSHLEVLDIVFNRKTCQDICMVLSSCHRLKVLDVSSGITNCPDLDLNQVISSMPNSLTKLCWGNQHQYQYFPGDPSIPSFPFHLLPKSIRQLKVWPSALTCTQSYYDYVKDNSIDTIVQYDIPLESVVDFLSSPTSSSSVKDLYLDILHTPPFQIEQRALVPPNIEVLELGYGINTELMECVFKYSGPLPYLHTVTIDSVSEYFSSIAPFIQTSRSLRIIDITMSFQINTANLSRANMGLLLTAMSTSPSLEKVYLRRNGVNKTVTNSIKKQFHTIPSPHPLVIIDNIDLIIINTNNDNPQSWSKDDTRAWLNKMKPIYNFNDELVDLELDGSILIDLEVCFFQSRTPKGDLVFKALHSLVEEFTESSSSAPVPPSTEMIRIYATDSVNRDAILNVGLDNKLSMVRDTTDQDKSHQDSNLAHLDLCLIEFKLGTYAWDNIQIYLKSYHEILANGLRERNRPESPVIQSLSKPGDYVVVVLKKRFTVSKSTIWCKTLTKQFEVPVLLNEDRWKRMIFDPFHLFQDTTAVLKDSRTKRDIPINSVFIADGGAYTLSVPWVYTNSSQSESFDFLLNNCIGNSQTGKEQHPSCIPINSECSTGLWHKIYSSLPIIGKRQNKFEAEYVILE